LLLLELLVLFLLGQRALDLLFLLAVRARALDLLLFFAMRAEPLDRGRRGGESRRRWVRHAQHLVGDAVGLLLVGVARGVDRELRLERAGARREAVPEGAGAAAVRGRSPGPFRRPPGRRPARAAVERGG